MSKSNSGLFGGTKGARRYYAGNISLMGTDDNYYKYIQRRKDIDPNGHFDVIAHGDSNHIEVIHNGKKYNVNHRELKKILEANPKYQKGQPIRLLSCNTGNGDKSFAQNLANKLNVTVIAPTKYAFTRSDGRHFVCGSKDGGKTPDYSDMGEYKPFYPSRRKK